MGAKSLIDKGLIRRIGNGRSTSIWEHKWIPGTITGKPTTRRSSNCELRIVDELICHKRWNRNIIFRTFNRNDAEKILSIPLSLLGREDSYFWQPHAGGTCTVSSGYKIMMEENRSARRSKSEETGPSYTDGSQQVIQIWNTLWRFNIKHKIKIFIWKCIKGALPVREAVSKKTGIGDPMCRTCGEEQEIIEQLLLNCPHTADIWKAAPIQWDGAKDQQGDFKRWWLSISEARKRPEGMEHIGLTANILCQVWKDRKKKKFESSNRSTPIRTVERAQKEWLEQVEVEK